MTVSEFEAVNKQPLAEEGMRGKNWFWLVPGISVRISAFFILPTFADVPGLYNAIEVCLFFKTGINLCGIEPGARVRSIFIKSFLCVSLKRNLFILRDYKFH
ncbi:MAG TPA: hypothetical protein PLV06_06005 [Bacteroidales bacterium]|nr:hypothetical protein [Bacteroidales bacterium]HPF03544.1 hypothetical protein [Bacteroidales bacterium]HPJ58771.1 hypothetical protein [Bacteroidales bacterium]HPR11921.1 hypothetical protein [Bacteroidales bacterium]HRW85380.1 hypothetical protein [Bacteroidales bacterium]